MHRWDYEIQSRGKTYYMVMDYVWRYGRWEARYHFGDTYPRIVFHVVNRELRGECYTYGDPDILDVSLEALFAIYPRKYYVVLRDSEHEKTKAADNPPRIMRFIEDTIRGHWKCRPWYERYHAENVSYSRFCTLLSCCYKERSFAAFRQEYMRPLRRLWPEVMYDMIESVYKRHRTYKGFFKDLLDTYGPDIGHLWLVRFFRRNMGSFGSAESYSWKIYKSDDPLCSFTVRKLSEKCPMPIGWRRYRGPSS